jgi:hypothetical protein
MSAEQNQPIIDPANQGIFANLLKSMPIPDGADGRLLVTSKSLYKVNGRDIHVGRDSNGHPHLLIPSDPGEMMEFHNLSALMKAGPRNLQKPGGAEEVFIDLECLSGDADALFAAISYEICTEVDGKEGFDGTSVISAITQTIIHWRAILDAIGDAQSSNAKTGLLGELLALTIFARRNPNEAFLSWTGPNKARHDFEFANEAYEIKTSTSLRSRNCVIHGMHQLNAASGTKLFLVHFQIELAAEGLNVNGILDELNALGISPVQMQANLSETWPAGSNKPTWFDVLKFKVSSCSKFEVDDEFPKITAHTLVSERSSHLSDVQYRINLDGLQSAASTDDSLSWKEVILHG